jgi:hypothetical protein
MNTKRQALGLAAVLAATVLTGGGAILGLMHRTVSTAPAAAVVVQHAPPAAPAWSEGGDN